MVFRCVECQIGVNWSFHLLCTLTIEGGLSRRYPVFLPSFAFTFVFAGLPALVELLAVWAWTVALAVVIAWVCQSFRFSCSFFFSCSWKLDRFVVDGYICRGLVVLLVTGWMVVFLFFFSSLSREREVRTAMGDGLRWWSAGFGFFECVGINLLLENKIWFFVPSFGEKPNSFFSNTKNVFMIFVSLNSIFFPSQEMWGEVCSECISGFWVRILWVFFSHHPPSLSCFFPHVPSPLLSSTKDIKMLVAAQIEVGADKLFKERQIIFIHWGCIWSPNLFHDSSNLLRFHFQWHFSGPEGRIKVCPEPIGANTYHLWFKEKEVRTHITP